MNIQPSSLSAKMFRRRKETSLQCRRILGGRKLLGYVRTVAEPPSCYDGGRVGRVKIVTLRVGARAKEAKRGGGGEKNTPLLLARPISPLFSSFNMRFREPEENACTAG